MKKHVEVFKCQNGNVLEYYRYGTGEYILICFPGFGESYQGFENLADNLPDYTVIAINIFGTGNSKRSVNKRYLSNHEWRDTLSDFLKELKIDRFSTLGFSLGGRFAISTFASFHHQMDHLILVAPDGIVKRFTYQLSTFPIGFRQLFYFLMNNPQPYFLLVDVLKAIRLINPYVANFSKTQMHDRDRRMLVYYSWITFKFLRLANKKLAHLANSSKCKTTFVFGEKDKIISPKRHLSFLSQLTNSKVLILPFGHNKLVDNAIPEIKRLLHSKKNQNL